MSIRTYDPKNVTVTFNGFVISGFADGTGIKVSRKGDMYSVSTGMHGDTSRTKTNDKSGEVVLTLAQTSPSNDVFTEAANATELDGDVGVLKISDATTGSDYASASAWPKKHADAEFGKELSNREWTLECVELTMLTKGNEFSKED